MSRVFLYARISTAGQTNSNQVMEVMSAGFDIKPARVIEEQVSGSVPASERRGFQQLLTKMEEGDVLVVTKLDRLGRNAMDVRATVDGLHKSGIRVHCLALGGMDLTSASGRMTMQVLGAVAEFERDLLIERTYAGLQRAKATGVKLGRPPVATRERVEELKLQGLTKSAVAHKLNVSLSTIKRLW